MGEPDRARAVRLGAGAIIALAWLPALSACVVGSLSGVGWEHVLRMIVTALVYAPAAGVLLSIGQRAVASVVTGLAVSSGLSALMMVLERLPGRAAWIDAAGDATAYAMHLSELAALGILIWLLGDSPLRRSGLRLGAVAIALDLGIAVTNRLWPTGAPVQLLLLPLCVALIGFLLGAGATVRRWWRGSDIERVVLIWFGLGAALLVASYLTLLPGTEAASSIGTALFVIAQGLLPTAILAAVFGGSGTVIDRRLLAGIVWAQALASAIGLYVLLHTVARALGAGETLAGGLAAAILALGFSVMLGVLRELTGLIFFGPGSSVRRILSRLGEPVSASGDSGGLTGLAEALREIWHLRSVSFLVGADAVEIARAGDSGRAVLSRRLDAVGAAGRGEGAAAGEGSAGAPLCTVVCTADDPALLSNLVEPMLEKTAGLVAVAVQLAQANQDLAALRERTRGVSREERRMLHRELHDELAPALAGIGFAMAGTRRLIASRAPGASDSLEELRVELAETTESVRRLARALLPAALDAGDLDGALRELSRRFSGASCAVNASAPGTDELGSEQQVAVYLVIADTVEILLRECRPTRIGIVAGVEDASVRVRLDIDGVRGDAAERSRSAIAERCAQAAGALTGDLASGRVEVVIPA
ncbi:histidine kinase [Leucobacter ruminantium]|uniref:Signal transduction histidine kinase subgroup 3 dimerisation and phosphoacceptor domain-containing protein n=1 Tax=Leucobacter ruminantium TaxID=1289170 RepID=A0A939LRV4_9MICO|nr:hypothetical protein [Leucobacter ruminantium]